MEMNDYTLHIKCLPCFVQGKVMNSFKRQGLKSEGFTGVQVWTEKLETIFKGSSTTEGFLYMTITSTGSPGIMCEHYFSLIVLHAHVLVMIFHANCMLCTLILYSWAVAS